MKRIVGSQIIGGLISENEFEVTVKIEENTKVKELRRKVSRAALLARGTLWKGQAGKTWRNSVRTGDC